MNFLILFYDSRYERCGCLFSSFFILIRGQNSVSFIQDGLVIPRLIKLPPLLVPHSVLPHILCLLFHCCDSYTELLELARNKTSLMLQLIYKLECWSFTFWKGPPDHIMIPYKQTKILVYFDFQHKQKYMDVYIRMMSLVVICIVNPDSISTSKCFMPK